MTEVFPTTTTCEAVVDTSPRKEPSNSFKSLREEAIKNAPQPKQLGHGAEEDIVLIPGPKPEPIYAKLYERFLANQGPAKKTVSASSWKFESSPEATFPGSKYIELRKELKAKMCQKRKIMWKEKLEMYRLNNEEVVDEEEAEEGRLRGEGLVEEEEGDEEWREENENSDSEDEEDEDEQREEKHEQREEKEEEDEQTKEEAVEEDKEGDVEEEAEEDDGEGDAEEKAEEGDTEGDAEETAEDDDGEGDVEEKAEEDDGEGDVEDEPTSAKPSLKGGAKVRNPYFDDEAELSGSEQSADEDEEDDAGLEEAALEPLEQLPSEAELRNQVGRVFMKQQMDEDKRQVMIIQEKFNKDGDLVPDKPRERKYNWTCLDNEEWRNITNLDDWSDSDLDEGPSDSEITGCKKITLERAEFLTSKPVVPIPASAVAAADDVDNVKAQEAGKSGPETKSKRAFEGASGSITSYIVRDRVVQSVMSSKRYLSPSPKKGKKALRKRPKMDPNKPSIFDAFRKMGCYSDYCPSKGKAGI